MKIECHAMSLAILIALFSLSLGQSSMAQTRLGLHVTQEELNVWKQRMATGPYKTAGDVSTNSPGDWTRIQNNANNFLNGAHPGYQQWAGQESNSCYVLEGAGNGPGRSQGDPMRDAAFVYLVTGTTSYRDAVRTELLAQTGLAGTDFSNPTRWCTNARDDSDNIFSVANWLTKLLFAYDYIRPTLSAGDKATLDTWFLNAGNYLQIVVDNLVKNAFPNRNSDNYSNPTNAGVNQGVSVLYFGGPSNNYWGEHWNNRSATLVRFFTLAGIMTNNSALKNQGKRWFKEWLKYNVFPDGTAGEFYRWLSGNPGLGWSYASMVIGPMVTIADALARDGDTELYNFSTSVGLNGTAGGPKSLKQVVTVHLQHVNQTLRRYGTNQAANNGNPAYLIDSIDEVAGEPRNEDTNFVPANLFYRDNFIKSIYLRQASGAPAYPANPAGSGWSVYGGEWGIFPGVLFMFGQMEALVNPYGGSATPPSTPPTAPLPTVSPISVDSTYSGYSTDTIDDGIINAAGSTATTWASADTTTAAHWIEINFPSSRQINSATIHWAFNDFQQKYMTSQRVDVQVWNGSSYVTAATMIYPVSDVPSTTVSFPVVTTSQVRFYQPANQGNPTYSGVLWITEVDYAYVSSPASPTSPTSLQVSVSP